MSRIRLAPSTQRRFVEHHAPRPLRLHPGHPALREGRSIFTSTVQHPDEGGHRVLKSGVHNRKIGGRVLVGDWRGMRIYTLTLEERATCPRSCEQWADCYGNHMHLTTRWRAGRTLYAVLGSELGMLAARHPEGFVVRLHVLGDFHSRGYVKRWASWLRRYPQLHVFGYTAHRPDTPVGSLVRSLSRRLRSRFAVRCSGVDTLVHDGRVPAGVLRCPAEERDDMHCGACTACWSLPDARIGFRRH